MTCLARKRIAPSRLASVEGAKVTFAEGGYSITGAAGVADCCYETARYWLDHWGIERDRSQRNTAARKARKEARDMEVQPLGLRPLQDTIALLRKDVVRLEDFRALFEHIVTGSCAALRPIIYKPPKKVIRGTRLAETCTLLVSDMHGGQAVRLEDTGGLNEFTWDILLERVEAWKIHVLDCLDVVRRGGIAVNRCVINVLGDMNTGEDVFFKQPFSLDRRLMDQIIDGAAVLANMVQVMAATFEEVVLHAVPGNHGNTRTTSLNADYMLYFIAAALLRDQANVKFYFTESPFMAYVEPGIDGKDWRYLLAHGDRIKAWNRIPYYGLDRARQEYVDMTKTIWDTIFIGHHHRSAEIEGNRIINGSFTGGDEFSVHTLRAASRPSQWMLMHHPKIGWTSQWRIYLAEEPHLGEPDKSGVITPYRQVVKA